MNLQKPVRARNPKECKRAQRNTKNSEETLNMPIT